MAVRLGYDQALLARVAEAFARALMHDMRWEVKARHGLGSVQPLHAGVFTAVQRFRSDLGLYVHLHCLVTDGAYEEAGDGELRFLPAPPPDAGAHDRRARAGPRGRRAPPTTTSTLTPRWPPACSSRSPARTSRPAHRPRRRR
jgi:hypothetical protein